MPEDDTENKIIGQGAKNFINKFLKFMSSIIWRHYENANIEIGTVLNIEYMDIIEGENPIVVKSKVIDYENG